MRRSTTLNQVVQLIVNARLITGDKARITMHSRADYRLFIA